MCIGSVTSGGVITNNTEALESPTLPTGASTLLDCAPYTESLGNGAFYSSWTSIAFTSSGTCAGVQVGTNTTVVERCVTAQGIVCPPTYTTTPNCPSPVVERVQQRVAAYAGRPVFNLAGVIGLNGILIENTANLQGTVATNKQLALRNQGHANTAQLGPSAPTPIIQNSASLGICTSLIIVSSCWTRSSSLLTLSPVVPVPAAYADGNTRIANAFTPSFSSPTNPHDSFSGCNSASSCGWNAASRTLNIPNGVTWTIGGANYNLCTLTLNGSSFAVLANGVRAAIYVDSPSDGSSGCTSGTGYLSLGNQSQFINNSPPLPGSPLLHDTTALQIYVFGPSDVTPDTYNNNACVTSSDPTCIVLGNQGSFYGTVFAPTSDIQVSNQGNTYGAIAGSTVTYNNPGSFVQDVNVPSIVTTGALGLYFRTAWSQCQAQPTSASDPMSGC
jgi:hypothetical protein